MNSGGHMDLRHITINRTPNAHGYKIVGVSFGVTVCNTENGFNLILCLGCPVCCVIAGLV